MSIARQVFISFFRRCIMINKLVSLIMKKQRNVSSNFSPAFSTDKSETICVGETSPNPNDISLYYLLFRTGKAS